MILHRILDDIANNYLAYKEWNSFAIEFSTNKFYCSLFIYYNKTLMSELLIKGMVDVKKKSFIFHHRDMKVCQNIHFTISR